MKQEKKAALLLTALLIGGVLSGCGMDEEGKDETPHDNVQGSVQQQETASVKTGLSVLADVSKSKDAMNGANGMAEAVIMAVGVMVDDNGIIEQCVIDQVKAEMEFDSNGRLATALDTVFPSKNELGEDYGMKAASSIGKEWYQQAKAFSDYVEGKTLKQVMGIALDEEGKAKQEDLITSATIAVGDFIVGIEDAVKDAEHRGAKREDELSLKITTTMAESEDAAGDDRGEAIAHAQVILETQRKGEVTSGDEEDISAGVRFDSSGVIVDRSIDQ